MTFEKRRTALSPTSMRWDHKDGLSTDIAIVGGGVSGCYCAWRLAGGSRKVDLFEASERLGGRLLSSDVPGTSLVAELGGMRYHSSHTITATLVQQVFGLDWHRFLDGIDETRFAYLRRKRVANAIAALSSEQACQSAYDIGENARQLAPGTVFKRLAANVLLSDPDIAHRYRCQIRLTPDDAELGLTRADWDTIKETLRYYLQGSAYNGLRVRDLGFQNLIKDQLSHEYYQYLADACGYYSDTQNWNAAEALHYLIGDLDAADGEYRGISGGYETLVDALAAHSETACATPTFWIENKLVSIQHGRRRRYRLVFQNLAAGVQWHVEAHRIILAMPRRAIELLDHTSFMFDERESAGFVKALRSVQGAPAFKLVMLFDHAWWLDACGFEYGKSVTDLPLRQCLYFGRDNASGKALLLASYNDMSTVEFWRALIPQHELSSASARSPWITLAAAPDTAGATALEPKAHTSTPWFPLVAEAVSDLSELHEMPVPFPEAIAALDWSADPYGGGYHAWLPQIDVAQAMRKVRSPDNDMGLHIVGEAYSDQQGWVEGALCTSERFLQNVMELERPDWLDPGYYLGR